jgi:chromosome segregation ATPase
MSVEFHNAYTEVLLENFDAVLKQNLMFQAKIKVQEKVSQASAELQTRIEELLQKNAELEQSIEMSVKNKDSYFNDFATKKETQLQEINSEKNRIQAALNEAYRNLSVREQEVSSKQNEIDSLQEEVKRLSALIPVTPEPTVVTKNKKIKLEKFVESAPITSQIEIGSGGTF